MKEFLKKVWKGIKPATIFVLELIRDWTLGIIGLVIGTLVIFFMGLSIWFLSGYKGVQNYFDALTGKKPE
jgi:hypothetical protein